MRDAGIFTAEDRVELIDGEVIEMSPIGPLHAAIVKRINKLLSAISLPDHIISVQDPIQLSDFSEPQPDIAIIIFRPDFYATQHPQSGDVMLIIEVADTSIDYDRSVKLARYAESMIPEVWIVDIDRHQIEQYALPANNQYRTKQSWSYGDTITSRALPAISLPVDGLMG